MSTNIPSTPTLTVWDSSCTPPEQVGRLYTWNGYAEDGNVKSLLKYAERHGESLRQKYLAWIHDLGETVVDDKRVIDHLILEEGLSHWWLTLFVEKSPYKSPISSAIRLLALEQIVTEDRPARIRLVSDDRRLSEALNSLCANLAIEYEHENSGDRVRRSGGMRGLYNRLPQTLQAIFWLVRYVWLRWPLKRARKRSCQWAVGPRDLFFCSYFFNLLPEHAREGRFRSRYWGELHALMGELHARGNWLQIYYPHDAVPNAKTALTSMARFNGGEDCAGVHSFVDSYVTWSLMWRVMVRWLRLGQRARRLEAKLASAYRPAGSGLSFYSIMREDWAASLYGHAAISNLLFLALFDSAMAQIPFQRKGLYVCENQAWERAFIHAWRKHKHGVLIAVPHSTIRFWDLRYYSDPRTLNREGSLPIPEPDFTALNGRASIDAYLGVGHSPSTIVGCEALRFGYLAAPVSTSGDKSIVGTRVLVLGDYLFSATDKTLKLLLSAIRKMPSDVSYTLKPHPNCPVEPQDYKGLSLTVTTEPLGTILQNFDVAYASNLTSAAVDARCAGLPVVVMLDQSELNFSPLRGEAGVTFVGTATELAEALRRAKPEHVRNLDYNEFFFLDPQLPRWRRLISSDEVGR